LGYSPLINAAGQTAFTGNLELGGQRAGGGIWAAERAGVVRLIVRSGDQLEVAPGDYRTVADISFVCCTTSDEGHFNAFNALGQVAFLASFSGGGEGIFVSSVAAVPEPNPLLLAAAAIVGLLSRLRPFRKGRCEISFDVSFARATARLDCRFSRIQLLISNSSVIPLQALTGATVFS